MYLNIFAASFVICLSLVFGIETEKDKDQVIDEVAKNVSSFNTTSNLITEIDI